MGPSTLLPQGIREKEEGVRGKKNISPLFSLPVSKM
jgi:hypothetical protein